MGKIFKDCKQCGARYLTCRCEVVSKDDLRQLVEKWEPYELPGEYESLYKDLKELLGGR